LTEKISTNAPKRPWALKLLPTGYERYCSDRLNPPPKQILRERF
jgi:hypothetical protein